LLLLLKCQIFYGTLAKTGTTHYRLLQRVKWPCFKNHDYYLQRCYSLLLHHCFTANFFNIFYAPNSFSVLIFYIRLSLSLLIVSASQLGIGYDAVQRIFKR